MAQHNSNVRVYVIPDLQQYSILGTDTMQKYKIVIDYENEQLFIKKNTNLKTINAIAIKPKSKMKLSVAPFGDLYKGLNGKILISSFLTKLGLKCDQNTSILKSDTKQLSISVNNIYSHAQRHECSKIHCNKINSYLTLQLMIRAIPQYQIKY